MFQTRTKLSFLAQASNNYKEYNLVAELFSTNLLFWKILKKIDTTFMRVLLKCSQSHSLVSSA